MATKNLGTATAVTSMQDTDCLLIETGGSILSASHFLRPERGSSPDYPYL